MSSVNGKNKKQESSKRPASSKKQSDGPTEKGENSMDFFFFSFFEKTFLRLKKC